MDQKLDHSLTYFHKIDLGPALIHLSAFRHIFLTHQVFLGNAFAQTQVRPRPSSSLLERRWRVSFDQKINGPSVPATSRNSTDVSCPSASGPDEASPRLRETAMDRKYSVPAQGLECL